ncbi:lysophospholipid acyltransferase family protein [Sporolactobacillus pectinivorans]|uniref:lysophospholipid acyltransferase family protein n=1 Tax=Sporolactobacillus pectinivorans TaxID=1591408 RepID=UPI000C2641CC|nr:1-acyl-sn-glycerol-3-phosphate acyltransferase [Sporolactobacillus pectinivorans]
MKSRSHLFFRSLIQFVGLFFARRTLTGAENVRQDEPAVFVCNHMGSYGPVMMTLFFPFPFRPWVTYQIVTRRICTDYLEAHFTQNELRLGRPFSRWVAAIIAPFCIMLVRGTGAIPVFAGSTQIRKTIDQSVDAVEQGDNLVIFPENDDRKHSAFINEFDTGFIHLGEIFHKKTGRNLYFYPVCINKNKKSISIGKPIIFSMRPFRKEKQRIKAYLQDSIDEMVQSH